MKGLYGWIQHKKLIAGVIFLSFLSTACIKKCDVIDRLHEGYDARSALKSTVKIYAKLTGKRKNLISLSNNKPDGIEIKASWVGSGVVVKNDYKKNESLILSVAHVTHLEPLMIRIDEDGIFILEPTKFELRVETLDGVMCSANSLAGNIKQDLSAITSKCIAGEEAELSDDLPPVGAGVMISGAALGYHPSGIFIITDGRYMGVDKETEEEIVTIPTAPGHSGSAIYYKGKIVGLLSKRTIAYEHISLCVNLENIKSLLQLAERIWLMEGV